VKLSARSEQGRRAMRTHREARQIANVTPAKLRALEAILAFYPCERTVVFTEDNATAYAVSVCFLIPCLTPQDLGQGAPGDTGALQGGPLYGYCSQQGIERGGGCA
jgi:hypothetical protein